MGMKVVRIVMESVGVADGILGMKPLLEAVQNGLQGTCLLYTSDAADE